MFGFRKLLKQIASQLEKLDTALDAWFQEGARSTNELSDGLKELRNATNRHDMAIEDLLDSWEELQQEQQKEKQALAAALTEAADRERRQATERENALLRLSMAAYDQLNALRRTAEALGATDWEGQLRLAEIKLNEASLPAGFLVIHESGVPVDYRIHEVIEVQATENPEREHTVAEVHACGYSYMGKIRRKAKISAYRLEIGQKDSEDNGCERKEYEHDYRN